MNMGDYNLWILWRILQSPIKNWLSGLILPWQSNKHLVDSRTRPGLNPVFSLYPTFTFLHPPRCCYSRGISRLIGARNDGEADHPCWSPLCFGENTENMERRLGTRLPIWDWKYEKRERGRDFWSWLGLLGALIADHDASALPSGIL